MNDSVSELVTCWLYRNTLTLCWVNREFSAAVSCGEGSVPFMMSAWNVNGVRLSAPAACSM